MGLLLVLLKTAERFSHRLDRVGRRHSSEEEVPFFQAVRLQPCANTWLHLPNPSCRCLVHIMRSRVMSAFMSGSQHRTENVVEYTRLRVSDKASGVRAGELLHPQ